MRTFQIAQPGDADVLGYADRDAPSPSAGQVLIRVAYAGLNFTDVLARRGAPGYATTWPFVPGMEVAGTVAALGPDATGDLAVGDRVIAFTPDGGGYAELVVADARLVALVPAHLDLTVAAGLSLTWATAIGLVQRAGIAAGDKVLVTSAAGGVGSALAAVMDITDPLLVVGGVGSTGKRDLLHPLYLPVVRGDGFYSQAVAAAGGMFDVVLDSVGGDVLDQAVAHIAVAGRLVSYGAAAGQPDPTTPAYAALRAGNQTLSGFSILRLARTAPERAGALIRAAVALDHDPENAQPTVIGWDALPGAHLAQSDGRTTGKTVVEIP